ncbi:hypothetical protein [Coralloluteibacterium thermophilus]|uniref:Uncharacterized protein n=1 Tax=Coralloluteibacterium thermophilum TaxID=2707049 RepID=A0ABV9NL24_9GAMM
MRAHRPPADDTLRRLSSRALAERYRALHAEAHRLFAAAAEIDDDARRQRALARAEREAAPLVAEGAAIQHERARRARRFAAWMRGCALAVALAGSGLVAWLAMGQG